MNKGKGIHSRPKAGGSADGQSSQLYAAVSRPRATAGSHRAHYCSFFCLMCLIVLVVTLMLNNRLTNSVHPPSFGARVAVGNILQQTTATPSVDALPQQQQTASAAAVAVAATPPLAVLSLQKTTETTSRPNNRESIFLERLNRLLPPTCNSLLMPPDTDRINNDSTSCISDEQDRRLFPEEIEELETQILSFNIPRRVVVDFADSQYLSLIHWRWKFVIDQKNPVSQQLCPRCIVRHNTAFAGMKATSERERKADPADVKVDDWCPKYMSSDFKDHENQTTVAGCGESQLGSGRTYAEHGRQMFDHDTSFEDRGRFFHRTFAHLHLSPPAPDYNLTELVSVTDMARALLRPPSRNREGDSRNEEATFIHNDCGFDRGYLVGRMIASNEVGIARYGKCFNNRSGKAYEPEKFYFGDCEGTRDSVKTLLSSLHKFTFSLENTLSRDYFTEKRYQALLGGSVPIVWNNHNSMDYLPDPDAAFVIDPATADPVLLSKQIRAIAANESEYAKYFAWKKRGLRASFVRKLFLSTDFVACRLCEYVAQNKNQHHDPADAVPPPPPTP